MQAKNAAAAQRLAIASSRPISLHVLRHSFIIPHSTFVITQPVRFALAGFGAWGKLHAQSIAGNPDARLVAITAPSEASREEARLAHPDARIFADAREMIAQVEFDIIDIVTPSHTHREIAVAACPSLRDSATALPKCRRSRSAYGICACLAVIMQSETARNRRLVRQNEALTPPRSGERAYTRAFASALRWHLQLHDHGLRNWFRSSASASARCAANAGSSAAFFSSCASVR